MGVIRATIEEFAIGAWVADVDLEENDSPSTLSIGGVDWIGQVVSTRIEGAVKKCRIVGGTAAIAQQIPAQSFRQENRGDILSRILANTGLSGSIDAPDQDLPLYCLLGGPLGPVLEQLGRTLSFDWWVTRVGAIRIGSRATEREILADRIATDLDAACYFSCVSCTQILPGDLYEGREIRHVRWRLTPDRLLAEVSFSDFPREPYDLGYGRTYPAKILGQDADNPWVNVLVDGRMGIYDVPLLVGGPFRVKMQADDLCRIGFENQDPRRPYAFATSQRGARKVAREGDTIDMGRLAFTSPDGPLVWTPPATAENPSPTPVTISSFGTDIYGVIDSGSTEVQIP